MQGFLSYLLLGLGAVSASLVLQVTIAIAFRMFLAATTQAGSNNFTCFYLHDVAGLIGKLHVICIVGGGEQEASLGAWSVTFMFPLECVCSV